MADEIVKVIKIDDSGSFKTMKDWKQYIDQLRASMVELDSESAEYKERAEGVRNAQDKVNQIMSLSKKEFAGAKDSVKGMRIELKSLQNTYDELSKAERESKFGKNLLQQIQGIDKKLKEVEGSTGRHFRNVGNYAKSVEEAFKNVGGATSGLIAPIKNVGAAMKALAANPLMAIVMVIAAVIMKIVEALKRNEQAMASLKKAAAPFQALMVGLNKVFDALAVGIGKAAEALANFWSWLGGGKKEGESAMATLQSIADKELQLAQQQRKTITENADAEAEVAELRAKSAEKNKYTAQERLEFLKAAGDKEKEIAERAYEDLKLQYEIIKAKNSLSQSSAEDLKAEAEAYAAMIGAKTNYLNKTREINAQISEAYNAQKQEYTALLNAQKSTIQAQIEVVEQGTDEEVRLRRELIDKEYEIAVNNAKNTIKNAKVLNAQVKALAEKRIKDIQALEIAHTQFLQKQANDRRQIELNTYTQASSEYFKKAYEARKAERKQILEIGKLQDETVEEYTLRVQAATEAMRKAALEYANSVRDEKMSPFKLMATQAREGSIEEAAALEKIAEMKLNYLEKDKEYLRTLGITEQQFEQMLAEANKAYQKSIDETQLRTEEAIQKQKDNAAAMASMNFGEDSMQAYDARIEAAQNYYDNLFQLVDESDEDFAARRLAAEQNLTNIVKDQNAQKLQNWSDLATGIGDIMGSIADYYQEDINARIEAGKITEEEGEKEFKKVKALQIAQATINTISGAIQAFMSCQSLGQPWGAILGAVQAAVVTAAGVAEIAKIKNTNIGSSGSGGGTSAGAAAISVPQPSITDYQPNTIQTYTGQDDTDNLANALSKTPIKAYCVESEITAKQELAKQREESTSF